MENEMQDAVAAAGTLSTTRIINYESVFRLSSA